jgi:hypothetical protein
MSNNTTPNLTDYVPDNFIDSDGMEFYKIPGTELYRGKLTRAYDSEDLKFSSVEYATISREIAKDFYQLGLIKPIEEPSIPPCYSQSLSNSEQLANGMMTVRRLADTKEFTDETFAKLNAYLDEVEKLLADFSNAPTECKSCKNRNCDGKEA